MSDTLNVFWFRRDLRIDDNAGLYHALKAGRPVLPIFIFDTDILDNLEDKRDKRVHFIHDCILHLDEQLRSLGSSLMVYYGKPSACFEQLLDAHTISAVYTNHDYEPYAQKRDTRMATWLGEKGIPLHTFKDQVIFEKDEVVKDNGDPYTVFTTYSRKWKEKVNAFYLSAYPVRRYARHLYQHAHPPAPSLKAMGFLPAPPHVVPASLNEAIVSHYDQTRDFPAIEGTTRLSIHLRFGTVSIRYLAARATQLNAVWLNELIWREFYQMILWHFPHVVQQSFKKEYDNIQWRNNDADFERWCAGQTGYPIVDAGMRQLNETGFMHNRVRMITASFLTKHLLIDWRWGEAYFAAKLLDYDLAANNGGWQWAAGCGCDAAPYFRIFNPYLQTQKFDAGFKYISHWVPEYAGLSYPQPMVDHAAARERCLKTYKKGLGRE